MSRCKYLLFYLIIFVLFTPAARAVTCSYEQRAELNSEVSNITASYEVLVRRELTTPPDEFLGRPEGEEYYDETDYFQINILNLTENTYAVVTNNYDNSELIYQYEDTDNGNIAIEWDNVMEMVNFTIEIYSSNASGCEGTLLRTIRLQLPRYNEYSELAMCDALPDYYLCQSYVTFDEIDFLTFEERIRDEIARKEEAETPEEEENPILSFLNEYKVQIIIGIIIVVVIAGGAVVIIKIKRRREII